MLTKWGAALGLASAGRVVAGGGGGPLGNATVWPAVADWTALGTIAGPLRVGDFAPVNDLGAVGSGGLAVYGGADWALYQATFPTVADLLAFGGGGELIATSAIAVVGTGVETDPAYYYDGAQWLRIPDGVHYIWQQRSNWADLSTVPAPQNNDRVAVQTLGTSHSSGVAERHGGTWKLVQGRFASVADMVAWEGVGQAVHPGAFAEVKSGGGHDDDSVTYVYQSGAWVRYAGLTNGYAWALSSITNIDPSGCGATQAGDFGLLNGRLYRLTVPLALPGGGTQAYWVAPEVYAGSVTIGAYLVGNEDVTGNTALNLQGWPTVTRTNGTITSQTTRVRLATTGNSGSVLISALTANNVITPTTKVYIRFLMRSAVGTGTVTAVTHVGIPAFGDGSNFLVGAFLSAAVANGTFFWTGTGTTLSGISRSPQAAVAGLSGSDDLVEVIINTTQGVRTCEMWRNGVLVATANVEVGAFSDQVTFRAISGSTASPQTATLDISHVVVATWA